MPEKNIVEVIIRAKDDATKKLKSLNVSLKQVAVGAGIAAAAMAAAAVAVFKFTEAVAKQLDILNKASIQTGLSVETLSQLRFAADQNKTSFESLQRSLLIFSRNLFDLTLGIGEVKEVLPALGIEIKDLAGLSTEQAFDKFAKAIGNLEDSGKRTAVAMRVFGRAGGDLVPLFIALAKGTVDYAEVSDRMGITIRTETAKDAEALVDALGLVDLQIEGLKSRIAGEFMPVITGLVKEFQFWLADTSTAIEKNRELRDRVRETATSLAELIKGIALLTGEVVKLADAIDRLPWIQFFKGVAQAADEVKSGRLKEGLDEIGKTAEKSGPLTQLVKLFGVDLAAGLRESERAAQDAADKIAELNAQAANIVKGTPFGAGGGELITGTPFATVPVPPELPPRKKDLDDAKEYTGEIKQATNQLGELMARFEMGPTFEELLPSAELLNDRIQELGPSWAELLGGTVRTNEELAKLIEQVGELGPTLEEALAPLTVAQAELEFLAERFGMGPTIDELTQNTSSFTEGLDFAQQSVRNLGTTMLSAITSGVKGFGSLGDSVADFIADLGKAIIKLVIFQVLLKSIGGPFGALFKGGGSVSPFPATSLAAGGHVAGGQFGFSIAGSGGPDRVPALLSAGEVVLPTIGGLKPADVVSELATLGKTIRQAIAGGASAGTTVIVQSLDSADGVREAVRHGAIDAELQKAFELGK